MGKKLSIYKQFERDLVKRLEGKQKNELRKYVSKKDGKIVVNWQNIENMLADIGCNDNIPQMYTDIFSYLKIKEIMTYPTKGSFFLTSREVDVSPNHGIRYHFTRKSDAEEYAKIKFSNSRHDVRIAQNLTDVINH